MSRAADIAGQVDAERVTQEILDANGVPRVTALSQFAEFAGDALCWSWGADERNLIAISCYISGIPAPIPATRFRNAAALMLAGGMPIEDVRKTSSSGLAGYFGLSDPNARAHDARDDAMSLAVAAQHLLRTGKLTHRDFD